MLAYHGTCVFVQECAKHFIPERLLGGKLFVCNTGCFAFVDSDTGFLWDDRTDGDGPSQDLNFVSPRKYILETLFVPHSGLRPGRRRTGEGPKKRLETALIVTETLRKPAWLPFSLHRVVRAEIEFGAYQLAVHTTPPGFERLPCRQAAWCCDLRGAMALHGSGQGGQKELSSESRLSFPTTRSQASRSLLSLWCGRAASSGILSVVL